MTLENIYYIGQTIAVIAILASLVAIYFQQRQSHVFERNSGHRDLLKQASEHFDYLRDDESLFEDVRNCLYEYDSTSPFRKHRFHAWCLNAFVVLDQANYQKRDGLMNDASHERFMSYGLAVLRTPGGRQWWAASQNLVNEDLFIYLSDRLSGKDAAGPSLFDLMPELRLEEAADSAADEKVSRSNRT